jgi:hypothetical protein
MTKKGEEEGPSLEVRHSDDVRWPARTFLDEVVVKGAECIHLECMDIKNHKGKPGKAVWWGRIYMPDGKDLVLHFTDLRVEED